MAPGVRVVSSRGADSLTDGIGFSTQSLVRKSERSIFIRGHSLIDDYIQDGDIIIVEKRETAENGESVVAMINGERVTLTRFCVEADNIRLQPANPAMEPIYLRHEELQILGIVSGVIRT